MARLFVVGVAAVALVRFCIAPSAYPERPEEGAARQKRTLASGRQYFVAANGTPSGNGTMDRPWTLQAALDQPTAVRPGDIIWLRGGTYSGTFRSRLAGTPDRPIIVRQYPGERVTIDGGNSNAVSILAVGGSYTWFWGLEVMSSDPVRRTSDAGSFPPGSAIPRGEGVVLDQVSAHPGLKFINMAVHDAREGFSFWKEAVDAEIYGCLVYYNGWEATDRGHGHNIYSQNETGTKWITDSILFSAFSHNIHIYGSSSAYLDNYELEGNTTFNAGDISASGGRNLLLGGDRVAQNPVLRENYSYRPSPGSISDVDLGYNAGCHNATFVDNYVADNLYFVKCLPVAMTGNTVYGAVTGLNLSEFPGNTHLSSRPAGVRVFVRPNRYEPGRANITVFNWDLRPSVGVDLSRQLAQGDEYEIRNVQDFFGEPVVRGSYDGNPVTLPMSGLSVASPVGWQAPPASGPEFNAFVLLTTRAVRAEPQLPESRPPAPRVNTRVGAEQPGARGNL